MSIRSFGFRHKKRDEKDKNVLEATAASVSDRSSRATIVVDDGSSDAKGPLGLNLLHAPSEPLFDFVFVHGLGGGSRRTWSKTVSVSHYWPSEWLPKDPAFKNVRIHSYGYASDWTKGNDSCLNLHHIGKSLLGALSTSPHIGNDTSALVLVGHSMGGLVIKKAYMLAHRENKPLAVRVRAIYFLGTPHRGSDSAKLLKNILQVASSAPAFVAEMVRGSGALQSINDEFRHYSADVELWSFYETRKLKIGALNILIVDPESATLGYREEKQVPMNADHRSISKFDDPSDYNFIIVRNSLVSTINKIATTATNTNETNQRDSIQSLATYLGVAEQSDDDLFAVQDARVQGTCGWILEKQYYTDWKDHQHDVPDVLWVDGKPATGKSVLAGFIIDDLKRARVSCSFYFFKHGDTSKSRLSVCLRSLAFQMASVDPGVRDALLRLQLDRVWLDLDNERTLWRTLFAPTIFEQATTSHCWVIDALDECTNFAPLLSSMLPNLTTNNRLKVLITSRETPDLCRLFAILGPRRHTQAHILAEETLLDIKRIIAEKGEVFFANSAEEDREALETKIIAKSRGSFLWTLLVLEELSAACSEEEITRVLDEVPRGMGPLYQRSLDTMALAPRGKPLAKAVLSWTACAMRPLTLRELECALEFDLKDRFPNLGESIRALCGQLVTIDTTGRVQMVHETAREFLLDDSLDSEFAVRKGEAHTRIASVCIEYLAGDDMKPPRTEKRRSGAQNSAQKPVFLTYAIGAFSSHLARADPTADHVLGFVDKFLKLNVLTWIYRVAETGRLRPLIRAAGDLKIYATLCMAERSQLRRDIQGIRAWSIDLQRMTARFADALIASPSAIYSRIPPFCPANSAIHAITRPGKRLAVAGLPAVPWDDRLSCLDFGDGQTSALCYGEEFLAVGLRRGWVVLYHPQSCQEYRTLDHGEAVLLLQFRENSDMLASCGQRAICLWNLRTGMQLHKLVPPRRCIGLVFYSNLLMAASNQNEFHSWDLNHEAAEQAKRPWRDGPEDGPPFLNRVPSAVSIAVAHRMMAIAYPGKPVVLWDMEQDTYFGTCSKKLPSGEPATHPVVSLLFNPNASIELLAISYLDGELAIVDPFADKEVEKQRVSCHTLTASPDGRLLAGGGGGGIIQIFEFDTLRLLYNVRSSDFFIKTLAFSRDGTNLADLRGSQCNIWVPPVLLAGAAIDDALSVDTASTAGESTSKRHKARITVMALMEAKEGILCGKDDGSVSLYDISSGDHTAVLYSHKAAVHTLCWLPWTSTVISTCLGNGVLGWRLEKPTSSAHGIWAVSKCILDKSINCGSTIVQLLPWEQGKKMLISTHKSDYLWYLNSGQEQLSITHNGYPVRTWLQHPRSAAHVICVRQTTVHVHRWRDLSEVVSISLGEHSITGLSFKGAFSCGQPHNGVLLNMTDAHGSAGTRDVCVLECKELTVDDAKLADSADDTTVAPSLTRLGNIEGHTAHVVGVYHRHGALGSKLIFLDTHSWVCSVELHGLGLETGGFSSYTRHFFVPYDWFAGTRSPVGGMTDYGDIIFAKNGDVAVIKGGLDYADVVQVLPALDGTCSSRDLSNTNARL